jgi:hypothetical protein
LCSSFAVNAQQNWRKETPDSYFKQYGDTIIVNMLPGGRLFGSQLGTRIDSVSAGTVYALPLDNMPCIVPDMKNHDQMPNVGKGLLKKPIDSGIYRKKFAPIRRS